MIYYNEFNPESAAMIRQFMTDGLIANGTVDERSIKEIDPDELKKYTQCHFFAGIAGWTFALQIAKWPTNKPVWTGSCPCQPFSTAGKQKGKTDERHLWPVWFNLIRECRPPVIFGEQVASAIAHGWIDDVYQGLESEGYAVGSAVLPACSVGAPHKRDRLFFVGNSKHHGSHEGQIIRGHGETIQHNSQGENGSCKSSGTSKPCDVANTEEFYAQGCEDGQRKGEYWGDSKFILCPDGKHRIVEPSIRLLVDGFQHRKPILHALGNAIVPQVAAKFIEATM